MFLYYYLQYKERKIYFNTLGCLFILYMYRLQQHNAGCKTVCALCKLHLH